MSYVSFEYFVLKKLNIFKHFSLNKDFHGYWDGETGLNAPLYSRQDEAEYQLSQNVGYAISYWIESGFKAEQINMGLPTYGHSFTLSDTNLTGIGSPVSGPGVHGRVSNNFIDLTQTFQ